MVVVAIADSTLDVDGQEYCDNGARFNEHPVCETCDSVHLADIFEEIGLTPRNPKYEATCSWAG